MIMRLASAGRAITPTGIRIMVSYLDQTGLEHTLEKLRNQMYPVGSLYFSTNSTSPATIYGGTWERYGKGRTLVSVNESDTDFTAGATGGSKTHNHKYGITVGSYFGNTLLAPNASILAVWSGLVAYDEDSGEALDAFHEWTKLGNKPVVGSNQMYGQNAAPRDAERYRYESDTKMGSSLSPYVAVYVWRRTA